VAVSAPPPTVWSAAAAAQPSAAPTPPQPSEPPPAWLLHHAPPPLGPPPAASPPLFTPPWLANPSLQPRWGDEPQYLLEPKPEPSFAPQPAWHDYLLMVPPHVPMPEPIPPVPMPQQALAEPMPEPVPEPVPKPASDLPRLNWNGVPFEPGRYYVDDGVDGCDVLVEAMEGVTERSKVLVYIPGSAGFGKHVDEIALPPQPSVRVFVFLGGKGAKQGKRAKGFVRPLPPILVEIFRILRSWGGVGRGRREIIALGSSRGAMWLMQLLTSSASLLDGAWLYAGEKGGVHTAGNF